MITPRLLSLGKLRALKQLSTPAHTLAILALDQRGNLRKLLQPSAPEAVSAVDLSTFKTHVVQILAPVSSGVLLDPEFGAAQCIVSGALPGTTGLMVAVEETGYGGDSYARQSRILPGWEVAKAKRMGASAVKLLVYYHPDAPTAPDIERLVQNTAHICDEQEIALFLEPLSYSLDPQQSKLVGPERRRVVIETARRLGPLGADVLKAEFPLDIIQEPNDQAWIDACAELSAASPIPWILLSAGVDYDTYLRQVMIACREGASGVAVGRAVWQEAASVTGVQRETFLCDVAQPRMAALTDLCRQLGRPWTQYCRMPDISEHWYASY